MRVCVFSRVPAVAVYRDEIPPVKIWSGGVTPNHAEVSTIGPASAAVEAGLGCSYSSVRGSLRQPGRQAGVRPMRGRAERPRWRRVATDPTAG